MKFIVAQKIEDVMIKFKELLSLEAKAKQLSPMFNEPLIGQYHSHLWVGDYSTAWDSIDSVLSAADKHPRKDLYVFSYHDDSVVGFFAHSDEGLKMLLSQIKHDLCSAIGHSLLEVK